MSHEYNFLDFYYALGGTIVPVTRDEKRAPLIKWSKIKLTKTQLIKKYPISKYNYAFHIPEGLVVMDIEATKGGLKQLDDIREHGFNVLATYHNVTGRKGIHAYFKITKKQVIPHGYSKNYKGIEFVAPGKLITIPPSIHAKSGKPYTVGEKKPLKKNIRKFPAGLMELFDYDNKPERLSKEDFKKQVVLQDKIDELGQYLSYLDPLEYNTYGEWVKLLFSSYDLVKGDKRGLELFINWSLKDERYSGDASKIKLLWKSVTKIKQDKNDKRNLITWKTIAYLASKAGAKLKVNLCRLVDEILNNNFLFMSTIENDGEYVRYCGDKYDVFKNTPKEPINGEGWARITDGVLSRIMGFIFDLSGIVKNDFVSMRVKDKLECNRVSLFQTAWDGVEFKNGSTASDMKGLRATKEIFFKCLTHKDADHAKRVYPFFVKYLVSGVKANLAEYDDMHRSNSQTCLCISSDRQGIGKSTLARALTPLPHMIYYPNLRNIRDMETKLAISRASMCIIDDYQPTYQKELNNLNEVLTQHNILVRPKYGRIEISKTKRAYFALTTNYKKILNDFTGTRRWINLDLIGMNIEKILKLAPRMHGEMIALARVDFRHWFTVDEINELEQLNEPFSGTETLDNILLNHYEINDSKNTELQVPAIEIMRRINRAYGNSLVRDVRQLGAALNRLYPKATSKRAMFEGKKLTFYNLKMIKPFDDRSIIITQGETTA
jgi:hypothetical protein